MLFGSKSNSAPRSDASSACRARASRSERSRSKSIRCSQSTAMVAPREAMFVICLSPSLTCSGGFSGRLAECEVERHEVLVPMPALDRALEQPPQVSREGQRQPALLGEVEHEV